jgi:hypothetical protein
MSSAFTSAFTAFIELKSALAIDDELRTDVQTALRNLLTRYNTQIYENRFIVGGVAERIVAATFVALGASVKRLGVNVTRSDISIGDTKFSVKGSFRPGSRSIRLINVMGDSKDAAWDEPTIFIISGRGIGYADPSMLPGKTKRAKDVIELPSKPLFELWQARPELLFAMDIPFSLEDRDRSDIASRIVADEILRYTKRLKPFDTRLAED